MTFEKIMIIANIILIIVVVYLVLRIVLIRQQLRRMKSKLIETRNPGDNSQITVELVDNALTELAAEINNNLDYQKKVKMSEEEMERNLRQSISDMAHDLRTPITVIKGNIQLAENESSEETRKKYYAICEKEADTLKAMVDDFFEISIIESGDSAIELSPIDLTGELLDFIISHEAVIRNASLEPEIDIPERNIYIKANQDMLGRILNNLLNNTIKYARGSFRLSVQEDNDRVKLTFSNWVNPRKKIDTDRFFERTYRAEGSRGESGAGLGLYIVKLLAEKQGANVYAFMEKEWINIVVEFMTVSK